MAASAEGQAVTPSLTLSLASASVQAFACVCVCLSPRPPLVSAPCHSANSLTDVYRKKGTEHVRGGKPPRQEEKRRRDAVPPASRASPALQLTPPPVAWQRLDVPPLRWRAPVFITADPLPNAAPPLPSPPPCSLAALPAPCTPHSVPHTPRHGSLFPPPLPSFTPYPFPSTTTTAAASASRVRYRTRRSGCFWEARIRVEPLRRTQAGTPPTGLSSLCPPPPLQLVSNRLPPSPASCSTPS